ncbi:hypothetical protein BS50DRAFT_295368 [Corynespora cassiicola Philippines]|uniref:Cytochrome P450 n=1 Tax=Corynespora cassiicola Philippines TaxID=1448308 RepID=A0A2T2NXB9_CORCC|nr:hypothetical protein BS50DRAFT_295368 [Corynespora cassiicola Philippines]
MAVLISLSLAAVIALDIYILLRRYAVSALRQYQCAPPRKHWSKDLILGMDFILEMYSNLAMMKRNHDRLGLTYQIDTLFRDPVINTIAPENLPLIHSNGKGYGIEPVRLPGMEYFCGPGFFNH